MKGKGIYYILNIINGDLYIGSAKCIHRRCGNHISTANRGKHRNPKLQSAFNKYGMDNFEFGVICYTININTEQELQDIEQKWIDFYKPKYNILKKAHRSEYVDSKKERLNRRGFKHTEETKIVMSKKAMGNKNSLGKKWKPDRKIAVRTKTLPSGKNSPSYGIKRSQESIQKRLETFNRNRQEKLKSSIPVLQYDLNCFFIKEWLHEEQASKELGIRKDLIRLVLDETKCNKTAGGYIWKYKEFYNKAV